MIGTKVTDDKSIDQAARFKANTLLSIDLWEPKTNYQVPLFHAAGETLSVPVNISECQTMFPHLHYCYHNELINLQAVDYVKETLESHVIRFKNSDFTATIRQDDISLYKNHMYASQIHEPQPTRCSISMLVIDIETRIALFLPAEDIIKIDLYKAKANYKVPRFYTIDRTYTVPLTLEMCHAAFPDLFPSDSGTLVNLEAVEHIESYPYKENYLKFANCNHRAPLAEYKVRHLKKIFPIVKLKQ